MEEDFQKAIDDLREVIKLMSLELSQKLDPIVPGGFHFSEDIYQKLKIKREETIQSNDNDLKVKKLTSSIPASNSVVSKIALQRPSHTRENSFLINYDYIDNNEFEQLINNLKKYNEAMQEARSHGSKPQFINYCQSAIKSIEAIFGALIEQEIEKISTNISDNKFLAAYEKAIPIFQKTRYPMPDIFIESSGNIKQERIVQIKDGRYLDLAQIKDLSLAYKLEIFSLIVDSNLDSKEKTHPLKQKFDYISTIRPYRNIDSHGSHKDIEKRIDEITYKKARDLYYEHEKHYEKIKKHIEWIVKEIYKRIQCLNNSKQC
jgi:hypothetical protein